MDPEHIIHETATIEGADIEEVYVKCKDWLQSVDAYILDESKPHYIKAVHRRNIMKNSAEIKFFQITITSEESPFPEVSPPANTKISFKINRSIGYRRWHLPWFEYVEQLWKHLGVPTNNETLAHLYPRKYLIPLEKDARNQYLMLMAIASILTVIAILFIQRNLILSTGLMTLTVIGFFIVILPYRNKSRHYKTMIQELYPENGA
jgi:hypothetical protein